jgi:hypothetical protein
VTIKEQWQAAVKAGLTTEGLEVFCADHEIDLLVSENEALTAEIARLKLTSGTH